MILERRQSNLLNFMVRIINYVHGFEVLIM